jgi:large subunit ribosomal protein L1
MGAQKNVDMTQDPSEIKHVEVKPEQKTKKSDKATDNKNADNKSDQKKQKTASKDAEQSPDNENQKPISLHPKKHERSKKYKAVRSKVDRTKTYDLFSAVELVKKLSYTQFPGTISAHLTVKEQGLTQEITFPHSTGQERKIEIASDKTLEKIEAGDIDFDVLLAAPAMMSKLTKYAPILGPQGLMPNPKNGTLTPKPEERKKELESGKRMLKTERKAPLIHVSIGKTNMETKKLVENLQALIEAFQNKLTKLTICATMSPGVKVDFANKEE